jgi:hypothetical protein
MDILDFVVVATIGVALGIVIAHFLPWWLLLGAFGVWYVWRTIKRINNSAGGSL